tara:strand:+ start:2212 stop:2469 length:258 start_codon:yes stop_codon:yes gene_type:complete
MANRGRPTQTKRQRERARLERSKMKDQRRADVRARREAAPPRPTDHDADLAGMVAGPQAPPDWQQEFLDEEQKAKEAAELNSDEK